MCVDPTLDSLPFTLTTNLESFLSPHIAVPKTDFIGHVQAAEENACSHQQQHPQPCSLDNV